MDILHSTQVSYTLSAICICPIRSIIFVSWNILVINACLQLLINAFYNTHISLLLRLSGIVKQLKTFLMMNFKYIAAFSFAYAVVNVIQDDIHRLEIAEGMAKVVGLYVLYSLGDSNELPMRILVFCKCTWWIIMEVYLDLRARHSSDLILINRRFLDMYSFAYSFSMYLAICLIFILLVLLSVDV